MTTTDLDQSFPSKTSKINWARIEESENFARTVKLFRQGKYDAAASCR